MAELDGLIRVRKHEVDERQKYLAELYEQAERLQGERDALESERAIEREKTKKADPYFQAFFASYSKEVDKKIERIDNNRTKLENRITLAQDQVREAFAELKKIEMVDERRKAEILKEIEKKESDFLDEVAINRFVSMNDDDR